MSRISEIIREALSNGEKEYTSGSINRAIILLSIPMILEMVWESLFAIVDVFFVSRISTNAVATIGLTEVVITLVYAIAIGLSMAATAMVSRRIGEKNPEKAAVSAVQALVVGTIVSVILGVAGLIFAEDILRLMGGSPELIASGIWYTRIIFATNIVIMMLFLLNGIFRGAGDAWIAMSSLMLANLLNIILDPLLIFGIGPFPELGIKGAAIATSIGRGTGVLFQLYILFRGSGMMKVAARHLKINTEIILRLLNVSIGGVFQYLIASASWIFLMRIIAYFGSEIVAGYTISIRVIIFTILPSWGLSNAAATLVGQNLGAGKPDRAERSVWNAAHFNAVFLLGVGIVFYIFAPGIISLFTADEVVVSAGVLSLRIFCVGYVFFSYGMILVAAFNGAGDTRTPTIMNFFCFWLFQIPLAYFLALNMNWGPAGAYWAVAVSEALLAGICIWMFRKGKWKKVKI